MGQKRILRPQAFIRMRIAAVRARWEATCLERRVEAVRTVKARCWT